MTVHYTEDPETSTVELRVSGRVTKEDFDQIIDPLQRFIDAQEKVRLIEVVESFDGFDASVLLPGIRFDLRNMSHISHVAVVSDVGWISPLSRAVGKLLPMRLRTFALDELDEARAWVAPA